MRDKFFEDVFIKEFIKISGVMNNKPKKYGIRKILSKMYILIY